MHRLLIGLMAFLLAAIPVGADAQFRDLQGRDTQDESDSDSDRDRDRDTRPNPAGAILIEPTQIGDQGSRASRNGGLTDAERQRLQESDSLLERSLRSVRPAEPNEFQNYVERVIGRLLPRYGADLLLPENRDFSVPADATIPPDYRINVGDTISISLTGSAEGSVERTVNTDGTIFLQSVGEVRLAGVRYGDLKEYLAGAIGTQFRNFRVGVRTTQLRGLRVFVTGYANNPGSFTISSLSTAFNAILQAGGPSAGGSFRSARLIRGGGEVAEIDLYNILIFGDRSSDAVLENEDVLLIPPADGQIAIFGSVNQEAIYEMRTGETFADALRFAGGISELGEQDRVVVYRSQAGSQPGPIVVSAAEFAYTPVQPGDIIQVLPEGSLVQPVARQSVLVRIEGEVENPGNYYVAPNTPLQDVVALAGGLTSRAYPFGTEFMRQSIVAQQRRSFQEALDQFEIALATAPITADASVPAERQAAQAQAARATLDKLREAEPDGRLILSVTEADTALPGSILLENGDRITIPPRPDSIGVYGAVYRPSTFQLGSDPERIKDYVEMAGGTIKAADKSDIFVVKANGSVVTRSKGALNDRGDPGDVVFVPVKTSSRDLLARIAQIASIVFQFGLTAATVGALD